MWGEGEKRGRQRVRGRGRGRREREEEEEKCGRQEEREGEMITLPPPQFINRLLHNLHMQCIIPHLLTLHPHPPPPHTSPLPSSPAHPLHVTTYTPLTHLLTHYCPSPHISPPPPHFMNRSSRCGTRYSRGTKVCSQAVMEGKQLTEKQMFTRLRTLESCLQDISMLCAVSRVL